MNYKKIPVSRRVLLWLGSSRKDLRAFPAGARRRAGHELDVLQQGPDVTQRQAAHLLGVSQPRVSDMARGRIDRFSVDMLVKLLGKAGVEVRLSVRTKSRAA